MLTFTAYDGLPAWEQWLHSLHLLLCAFAVLLGLIPLVTPKGSAEHKLGGLIYVPVSLAGLALASWMAWAEQSLVLFCFNSFCAYLLLSGWRAVHEQAQPRWIDWLIPGGLVALAMLIILQNLWHPLDDMRKALCLMFFAFNGCYLGGRDLCRLRRKARMRSSPLLAIFSIQPDGQTGWMGRHIAGMVGSLLANLSVIVLTLLPLELHWLWPATLITLSLLIALQDYRRKSRLRRTMARIIQPDFAKSRRKPSEPFRRAA